MSEPKYSNDDLWDYMFGACADEAKKKQIEKELEDADSDTAKRLREIAERVSDPYKIPASTFTQQPTKQVGQSLPFRDELIDLIETSLAGEDHARQQLERLIEHQLSALLRLRAKVFPSQPLSKRDAVDGIVDQLLGDQALERTLEQHFMYVTASVLRRTTYQSAKQLASPDAGVTGVANLTLAAEETIEVLASDQETVGNVPAPGRSSVPGRLLARERALEQLESEGGSGRADLYLLHFFAGRNVEEIARLREEEENDVAAKLDAVTRHVEFTIAESLK